MDIDDILRTFGQERRRNRRMARKVVKDETTSELISEAWLFGFDVNRFSIGMTLMTLNISLD